MNLQFLPRTLMIFGALLIVLGGIFYMLDKYNRLFYKLDEKLWFFYISTAVILVISVLLTIAVNGIWRP